MRRTMTVVTLLLATTVGTGAAGPLDDALDDALRGAWAIVGPEIYSACSGTYSDNIVGPAGVSSKAVRRFAPGELVKIDKVKVKRSRVDLLVTLGEPVLDARVDGPFTLYDERSCRAQLIFELPRQTIKTGDVDAVLAVLARSVTTHGSRSDAEASEGWNQRRRDPYPDYYHETLAAYDRWRAEQTNAAVAAAIDHAVAEAADAVDDIEDAEDYLAGLAAGAERLHDLSLGGCDSLLDATFSRRRKRAPSERSAAFKRGFEDGQRMAFFTRLARDLYGCFVPVPAEPLR